MERLKNMKKTVWLLLAVFVLLAVYPTEVHAGSYTYDVWDNVVPSPEAYEWVQSIRPKDIGISAMDIKDMFYKNGKVYIAATGQIIILNENLELDKVITEYENEGSTVPISAPTGIFVTDKNEIYIAEQNKGLIVELDQDGGLIRELGDPHIVGIENVKYAPTKVVVDNTGRIFVQARSIYEGILELDPEGMFNRFIGANEVRPNMAEVFWRKIATEEQLSRMNLWLPTDYSDIALDDDGYIMATIQDNTSSTPIRKLNTAGEDVMNYYEFITPPKGDYTSYGGPTLSTLTNIATASDGRFAVIDATRGRVFVYAPDGILLYVLGGTGKRSGELSSAVDIVFMGDTILVADYVAESIEVFNPTEYGNMINDALKKQSNYDYEGAAVEWQQVYDINQNSTAANMGLGKYHLRAGHYEEALESFRNTGERKSYSAAFERVRETWMENNLGTLIIVVVIVVVLLVVVKKVISRQLQKGWGEGSKWRTVCRNLKQTCLKWPGYMMSSPFKAFDDVKYENAGSLKFAVVLLVLLAWVNLLSQRYTGFLMNYADVDNLNVPLILVSTVLPYLIFVLGNWAVGVLLDGKGNMRNIFKVICYALYPYIICSVITILLSRICIYEETGIVSVIKGIGFFLFLMYTFIGLIMVHQYSFTKGVGTVVLSFVAMMVIIFVIVLLATLVSGFINDVITIVNEYVLYQ